MKNLKILEKQIKISFKDKDLLKNAFIHRSYLNENKDLSLSSNEKLEFLGDSVLSFITSVYLYKGYPLLKEGEYTEIKSSIVKTGSLAAAAQELQLGDYLFLSKGEESGGGIKNKNILADCFEALIGSIFIDQGFEKAYSFVVKNLFRQRLDTIISGNLYFAAKSRLQELSQAKHKMVPQYKVLEEKGPEHRRTFRIGIFLNGKKLAEGSGPSKKQAEEEAASKALKML